MRIKKVVISSVAWGILSASVCIPSVVATLSEADGSRVHKVGAFFSASGTAFSWFSLTFYGGFVMICDTMSQKSQIEIILFRDDTPTISKAIMLGLSGLLALSSRVVSITEGVKFTRHKTWGLISGTESAIAEAGLPALGLYMFFRDVVQYIRIKYIAPQVDKKIERVREHLIEMSKLSIQWGLRATEDERRAKFKVFYLDVHASSRAELIGEWRELLSAMTAIYDEHANRTVSCAETVLRKWPRMSIQVVSAATTPIPLFILDALLAGSAYSMVKADEYTKTLGMILAFLPLIYVVPKMIATATGMEYDIIYDALGGQRDDKSFADEFYPILSKLLKVAAAALSVLQFDEEFALTKLYCEDGTWQYDILSLGNIVACSFLITASFYYIIDELFESYALSSNASADVYNAAYLKLRLGRMMDAFQKIAPDHLAAMLGEIGDDDLKNKILNGQMTPEELMSAIARPREDTPLLAPV